MSEPQRHPDSHPLNAPGDFYVLDGMCIACEAPEHEAPDLMAHEGTDHCYFKRQPETPEETKRACSAVEVGCCGAVRYGGRDPEIIKRLDRFGRDACDHAPDQPPKGAESRWFDRKVRGSSIAEWSGVALMIAGGANAVGASKWAGIAGEAWHPLAWLVFLPMFAAGCAILFWSLRRDREKS